MYPRLGTPGLELIFNQNGLLSQKVCCYLDQDRTLKDILYYYYLFYFIADSWSISQTQEHKKWLAMGCRS